MGAIRFVPSAGFCPAGLDHRINKADAPWRRRTDGTQFGLVINNQRPGCLCRRVDRSTATI